MTASSSARVVVIRFGLLLYTAATCISIVHGQPTTLTNYVYNNIDCSGEPAQVLKLELTAAGSCDTDAGDFYPFVDPSGEFIYWYAAENGCPQAGAPPSAPWSEVQREQLGNTIDHGQNTCSNYVIENAQNAYPAPFAWPPPGWMLTYQNLNATTGQPTTNCDENERVYITADALLCDGGQQTYCQASADQTMMTRSLFFFPDATCQQPVVQTYYQTFTQECDAGTYYGCPSENTIPEVDFQVAYYEYDTPNPNNCTSDMGDVYYLYPEGPCVLTDLFTATIFSCNANGTITLFEWYNEQTKPNCVNPPPGTVTRVFNYPVDTCLPLADPGNLSNFKYTCNEKPTPPSSTTSTPSIFEPVHQQHQSVKKSKKVLTESSL